MQQPSSSSSKMIRWSVKRTRADSEALARTLVAGARPGEEGMRDGTVLVEDRVRRKAKMKKKGRKKKGDDRARTPAPPPPGQGQDKLRFSVILRVCEGSSIQLMRLIAPFAASEGIRKDTGIITWIRWLDRVVIGERTVATATLVAIPAAVSGMTADDHQVPRDPAAYVILTFGVNIRRPDTGGRIGDEEEEKGEAVGLATSLQDELGVEVDEGLLLEKILESLAWMHLGWRRRMDDQIVRRVKTMVETVGRRVTIVDHTGGELRGYAKDIDGTGRLVVELGDADKGSMVAIEGGRDVDGTPYVRLQ